jgi:hypothetical protein
MKERTLLVVSLICVLVGIPLLMVVSFFVDENPRTLVKVSGSVESVKEYNSFSIVRISMDTAFPVVVFETELGLAEGDLVVAKGRISGYNGKPEFVADEIKIK